jgi:hypothetical protein
MTQQRITLKKGQEGLGTALQEEVRRLVTRNINKGVGKLLTKTIIMKLGIEAVPNWRTLKSLVTTDR